MSSVFGYNYGASSSNSSSSNITIVESVGRGFTVRGTYEAEATYNPSDVVLYGVSSYVCKNTSSNHLPTETDYFSLLCLGAKPFTYCGAHASQSYLYFDIVTYSGDTYFCNDETGCTSVDIPGVSPLWTKLMDSISGHSELTGLTTGNDHTQYVLLDGNDTGGGQIICGGATAAMSLQLKPNKAGSGGVIYMYGDIATNNPNTYSIGSTATRFKDLYMNTVTTGTLTSFAGTDMVIKLTDTLGVQKLKILNSLSTEVASIDSLGKALTPSIVGGTASGGSLALSSTTHSTKGPITFSGSLVPAAHAAFSVGSNTGAKLAAIYSQNVIVAGATVSTSASTGALMCGLGGMGCDHLFANNVKTPLISVPTGDVTIKLNDYNGVNKLYINNSDNMFVASIDSNGNIVCTSLTTLVGGNKFNYIDETWAVFRDNFRALTLAPVWVKTTVGEMSLDSLGYYANLKANPTGGTINIALSNYGDFSMNTRYIEMEFKICMGPTNLQVDDYIACGLKSKFGPEGVYLGIKHNPLGTYWTLTYLNTSTTLEAMAVPLLYTLGQWVTWRIRFDKTNFMVYSRLSDSADWTLRATELIPAGPYECAPFFEIKSAMTGYLRIASVRFAQDMGY